MDEKDIIGFEPIYDKIWLCKAGVSYKPSVAHFLMNSPEEAYKLSQDLILGKYYPRKTHHFIIYYPKKREIVSTTYRDRVYQRSLNDNVLYPAVTKQFIAQNTACQIGKGPDYAREYVKKYLHWMYRRYGVHFYGLKIDIHGYYPNMKHQIAKDFFWECLEDDTYKRAERVLNEQYGEEIDIGFNPGSQMIQIAGIGVLNQLDHFIKERLKIKCYVRTMDDLILFHQDREYLQYCQKQIEIELRKIGFEFNPKKTIILNLSQERFMYLGFYFRITSSGKVILTLNPKNIKHAQKRLRSMVAKAKRGEISKEVVDNSFQCWANHASKGNSYLLLQRMNKFYKELWKNGISNSDEIN